MNNAIIKPEEVFDSLLGGFEVLMVNKKSVNRFGVSCVRLSEQVYEKIDEIVNQEDNSNIIFIQTEKYVKKEENKDEK